MNRNIVLEKLKSSRGETITETLVATLIAAISMILFASMVIASKNVIKNSSSAVESHYEWTGKMGVKDSSVKTGSGTVHFETSDGGNASPVSGSTYEKTVTLFYNQDSGATENNGDSVIRY